MGSGPSVLLPPQPSPEPGHHLHPIQAVPHLQPIPAGRQIARTPVQAPLSDLADRREGLLEPASPAGVARHPDVSQSDDGSEEDVEEMLTSTTNQADPTPVETALRLHIEDELARAMMFLDKNPRSPLDIEEAGQALDTVALDWAKLVKKTYARLGTITDEETRATARASWLEWRRSLGR